MGPRYFLQAAAIMVVRTVVVGLEVGALLFRYVAVKGISSELLTVRRREYNAFGLLLLGGDRMMSKVGIYSLFELGGPMGGSWR